MLGRWKPGDIRFGDEVRGVFCSQLIGDIIEKSGLIESSHVHESPGSLHDKIEPFYCELPAL